MDDLFGENIAAIPASPKPASVLHALNEGLPLAYFLVAFARYKRGKFREKQRLIIAVAIQERLSHWDISAADVLWWITEGLPKALGITQPIEVLATRLDPLDIPIARRAAINITGPSQSPTGLACISLIGQLLPTG